MSVLIKGMEMPTDCHNCPLGFGGGCYCGTSADEYMCPDHGRAEWCPLAPVPPHGRLIDADALGEAFTGLRWDNDGLAHWGDRKDWCLRGSEIEALISASPTIIPASEKGEV